MRVGPKYAEWQRQRNILCRFLGIQVSPPTGGHYALLNSHECYEYGILRRLTSPLFDRAIGTVHKISRAVRILFLSR